jgi:predicted glycosyltransferase
MALYHRFENALFFELIAYLLKNKNVTVIAIPRSREQKEQLKNYAGPNLVIPEKAIDGMKLIEFSDLVISAGGTMTREAAVMGTPSYTLFKGVIGAADKYLIAQKRITPIFNTGDFAKIELVKKKSSRTMIKPALKDALVNIILS